MSEFYKILKTRNLDFHSGQPVWKYNISDLEFNQLKERFKIVQRLSELDPRDCAIYYAEWWKRCYNESYPRKEDVYNSIDYARLCFNADEFFELAKKGGNLLNYKWIKIQNTLYLKTLLIQGGLPLKHIQNNQNSYTRFLQEIVNLNPFSIDEFSNNTNIINLLPASSRNDIIYSSCLEIARYFIDNPGVPSPFPPEIIIIPPVLRSKKFIKFKWNFNSKSNTFFLNTTITSKIGHEELNYILDDQIVDYQNEYKLFVGVDLIAKLIKRNNETYKVIQFKDFINFKEDFEPEIYVIDSYDKIYQANHLLNSKLNLDFPTLWLSSDEEKFVLEKSRYTHNNFGYVILNQDYSIDGNIEEKIDIEINGKSFSIIKFQDEIKLKKSEGNTIRFKTNTENIFDWTILSEKPKWLVKGNLNVVKDNLRILVYDKNGQRINNPSIEWKSVNKITWNSKHIPLELGVLDVKISYDGIDEFERVFNIGSLCLSSSSDYNNPQITVNNNSFNLEIYKSDFFNFSVNQNKVNFNITNSAKFPTSIKTRIRANNQSYGLIADIISPFQGVILVDQNENIIKDDEIYLDKIRGWRLITNSYGKEYEIRFSNNKNQEIIISKKIERKVKPLFEFYDTFKSLFQLFNIIDSDNFLKMEIYEIAQNGNTIRKRRLVIKQFSKKLKWEVNSENVIKFDEIESIDISSDLYVLPIDCDIEHIDKIEIIKGVDFHSINTTNAKKFILFSDKTSKFKIKPEFISIDPENEITSIEDRNSRILNFACQLLNDDFNSDVWSKFWVYYYLCKENDLPFVTLDIIKAVTTSSKLAAKAFAFLSMKFDENNYKFSGNDFIEFENDLGFSFHWVSKSDWENICLSHPELYQKICVMMSFNYKNLSVFLLQDEYNNNFTFNQELIDLRQRLGISIIEILPKFNIYNDTNTYIRNIPNQNWPNEINILVMAPLIVATSIRGMDTGLWHENGDNFRRRIRYVENLDKKWYEESLIYYLN